MADFPFDMNQAKQLLDMGKIDQATFDLASQKLGPQLPVAGPEQLQYADPFAVAEAAPSLSPTPPPVATVPVNYAVDRGFALQNAAPKPQIDPSKQPEMANASLTTDGQQGIQVAPYGTQDDMTNTFMQPFEMQQAAVAQGLKAAEMKGAEQAATLDRAARDDQKRLAAQEAAAAERNNFMQAKLADLNTRTREVAGMSVDPNRFWANKSTGEKVLAGIGLFLGAFGSNGNKAANIISDAITQDINVQKANIDQKGKGLSNERSLYNDMYAAYKDKDAAEAATRLAMLNNAQVKAQAIGARYQGPEAKAKAMSLMGEIEAKKNEAALNFQAAMSKMYGAKSMVGGTVNPELLDEKQRERYVPGFGIGLTKEDATKLKDYNADYEAAREGIIKLKAVGNKPMKSISPEAIAQADSISRMIMASLRTQVLGPGAVTDAERAILEKIVANPTSMFSLDSTNQKRLDTLIDTLKTNRNQKAKAYGFTVPDEQLGFQKK